MSAYDIVLFFVISFLSVVIALICWLLKLIFDKLKLNDISEIFDALKRTAILAAILFGGFIILILVFSGIASIAIYITNFIISLF